MSFAPQPLLDARAYLRPRTGLPDAALGIVGDSAHRSGYHLGADRLRSGDYSARTARDRAGLSDAASALDVGSFARLRQLTAHLVALARDGRLPDVRELIGPWSDGRAYRWDHQAGWSAVRRAAGDSHEWHLHISYYRDSERRSKLAPFRGFFEGDDMPLNRQDVDAIWNTDGVILAPQTAEDPENTHWTATTYFRTLANRSHRLEAKLAALDAKVDLALATTSGLTVEQIQAATATAMREVLRAGVDEGGV